MKPTVAKRIRFTLLGALLLFGTLAVWQIVRFRHQKPLVQLRGSGETIVIAAAGDWLTHGRIPSNATDSGFAGVTDVIKNASLGVTTLEENLLHDQDIPTAEEPDTPRWPHGSQHNAHELRRAGFTVISLADNHAFDYGVEGMQQTWEALDHEGLLRVGSGEDLQRASAPVYVGAAPRLIAVIAVTTSAAPQSRATYTRDEILGRPGVNLLRYSPRITVDPSTFAALQRSGIATPPKESGRRNQLLLSGNVITQAQTTQVDFIANRDDCNRILAQIRLARSQADIVVVMLHSHEPSNQSQVPADFVRQFAHDAVDAGANLIVGDGPHQLRGIELYKGSVIFYSLGNFAFDYNEIDPRATDVYETGIDFYQVALGAMPPFGDYHDQLPSPDESAWWESAVATVGFDHSTLLSIHLYPIDLGVDLPLKQRGIPHWPSPQRGSEILERLAQLSQRFDTRVDIKDGLGTVDLNRQGR